MKTLIIYAHPYDKSFNHVILKTVEKKVCNYETIDLYKDNFNPVYTNDELKIFKYGKTLDPLVEKYQKMILNNDKIIFIFPIWWNECPSIVKGFFDKVFKYKFSYIETKFGIKGKLNNIKEIEIYTTSNSPTWYLKACAGNYIKKVLIKSTFKQVGIKHCKWHNLGNIKKISSDKRINYLNNIRG